MPIPLGKNDLSAYAIFTQRKLYKEESYPKWLSTPIDLWYDKVLYGRVDSQDVPITLQQNKVKKIESGMNNVFALDFVADAFEDFRKHYLYLNQEKSQGTVFEELRAIKGWSNVLQRRETYLDQIYTIFTESYLTNKKRYQNVVSFKTFLNEFLNFMKTVGERFPVTLTNYVVSNFSDPLISGIMLEIDSGDKGEDEKKYLAFLENVCFPCYTEAAEKYGFKIDKNAPWRLVADLKSPALQCYMNRNQTTFNNVFETSYDKTYLSDMGLIKEACMTFYHSYVLAHPSFTKFYYSEACEKTIKKVVERPRIYRQQVDREFSDSFWMSYYIKILQAETGQAMTENQVKVLATRAAAMEKKTNLLQASKLIFSKFKKSILGNSTKRS